jgi:vacuolar-type H+-ATPase subunit D/Vma8
MKIFMDRRNVMGVTYPIFSLSACRNKSQNLKLAGIRNAIADKICIN